MADQKALAVIIHMKLVRNGPPSVQAIHTSQVKRIAFRLIAWEIMALTLTLRLSAQAVYAPYVFNTMAGLNGSLDGPALTVQLVGPRGVTVDAAGNAYIADYTQRILKVTPSGEVSTLAGSAGVSGSVDGTGPAARFVGGGCLASDSVGNTYYAGNGTVRRITPSGAVTTIAGTPGGYGNVDGTGAAAQFKSLEGIAVDQAGNVYVSDPQNAAIRKITPGGVVTTFAGSSAQLSSPAGVAVDQFGNVYVADSGNYTVRKITPAGVVSTFAGTEGVSGTSDGQGTAAQFTSPYSLAVDPSGNLYVGEYFSGVMRKITPGGMVFTIFGGVVSDVPGRGFRESGIQPIGLAVDPAGNLLVADYDNNVIWKISVDGPVTVIAGTNGGFGISDGTGANARFDYPEGLAIDSAGNLYVADSGSNLIRKMTPAGAVSTLAGSFSAFGGSADGTGAAAQFASPSGVAVDAAGNVYVADTMNDAIRKITPAGVVTTLAGTAGVYGSADGIGSDAQFARPGGIAVDQNGSVYVADTDNNTIRKITPAGTVTTFAGTANPDGGSADGTGPTAQFNHPAALAVDSNGNVYVADTVTFNGLSVYGNNMIRKITPGGVVTTLAGAPYFSGGGPFPSQSVPYNLSTDGTGAAARFFNPLGIAVDTKGYVYVADSGNDTIRRVTPDGVVTTLAGSAGVLGSQDGAGAAARFNSPYGIAVDSSGNLFVADSRNNTIRVGTSNATLSVVAEPSFASLPASQVIAGNGTVVFRASSNTTPAPSYQWYFDGAPIAGAIQPTLLVTGATGANAGYYDCVATNSLGVTTANSATLTVISTPDPGRLINISVRSAVGQGGNVLIGGFVVGGADTTGGLPVLVRASGPALTQFGVPGVLPDPELQLSGAGGLALTNSGWAGSAQVSETAAAVGAFTWMDPTSKDAALVETLSGGPYTALISGVSGDTGVALIEVYDATAQGAYSTTTPRLINISGRAQVGTGASILIAGFVIGGTTSETVLIRAAGPAIAASPFGVSGTLRDPDLQLYAAKGDGTATLLAANIGWGGDPQVSTTAASVGAFSWGTAASADSALIVTLAPGAYIAEVSGAGGDTGVALVEVYEVQ
jgi:sugar lactone lactonase YvrE